MADKISIETERYIEREIKHLEGKIDLINADSKDALAAAKTEMDRRLEGMNAIRKQLEDQAKTFVRKEELALVEKDIKVLSKLVYIGLGVWLLLQLIIVTIITLIFGR